jgi:hypothetical protein
MRRIKTTTTTTTTTTNIKIGRSAMDVREFLGMCVCVCVCVCVCMWHRWKWKDTLDSLCMIALRYKSNQIKSMAAAERRNGGADCCTGIGDGNNNKKGRKVAIDRKWWQ